MDKGFTLNLVVFALLFAIVFVIVVLLLYASRDYLYKSLSDFPALFGGKP